VKALASIPLKKAVSNELAAFTKTLRSKTAVPEMSLSNGLCLAAKEIIAKLEKKGASYYHNLTTEDMTLICRKYTGGFEAINFLFEEGTIDNTLPKLMISEYDPKRTNKNVIFDPSLLVCGVSTAIIEEEEATLVIFADSITEGESKHVYNPDDYPELKEAFDMFDVSHIEKIDCNEIKGTMKQMGFQSRSPIVYQIIEDLDNPENLQGADFNTFMDTIVSKLNVNSKEGLYQIFSLYKDDVHTDTISLRGMKKMATDLEEKETLDEINGLITLAGSDGVALTFEEFSQFYTEEEQ